MRLSIGLPKGSLQEASFELFRKAGFTITASGRSYVPRIDDDEIEGILIRAQEISRYVEQGILDVGLTGRDWIVENGSDVEEIADLIYGKQGFRPVRWVLAVPNDSPVQRPEDLAGKRIATEAVNITKRYLEARGISAAVEFSWGATEVKVPQLVDAIVELTETGSSLRAHNLRVVDTLLESTTRFIANRAALRDPWKKAKIAQIAMLLNGALSAEAKVGVKMNVPERSLAAVGALLPALRRPTVSRLSEEGWCAVETILDEKLFRSLVPKLKAAGAEGIIEYPLNKVIP
ncbi:MAG: ATP phosphoribosyltransferase [Candidatus Aureabacteria bacterium]|nr:ATP phosphoribosyltransferase [Candidatus Auribacterota bacterium]